VKCHCGDVRPEGFDGPPTRDGSGLVLDFFVSELRLRGDAPIVQPHEKDGNVFCWNGEVSSALYPTRIASVNGLSSVFPARSSRVWMSVVVLPPVQQPGDDRDLLQISAHENDGVKLFETLRAIQTPEQIQDLFGTIEGP
jgi:hypothetical protein